MRILSWNTNSWKKIRNYQPFFSLDSWSSILDHLAADVVCLQETKLTRKQAVQDRAMCLPDETNWESFWDFHPSRGYSGTVIYVKKSTVGLPSKAEYGLTGRKAQGATVPNPGVSASPAPSIPASNESNSAGIGCHPTDCKDELDDDIYRSLDEEGRCVVVDFGFFVLFNLYCPVMSSPDSPRHDFRNAFHQCLNERARKLIARGRHVIIVGDINIARQPIDHCDYSQSHSDRTSEEDKELERQAFYEQSQARRWFSTFLQPRGPFHDVQREAFPTRIGMYTCWSTLINARPANYGTRIDYTLVSPGLKDWVKGADIQNEVPGSDHCPVYVDFYDEREIDGKVVKLRDLLSNAEQPPPLAASRWEEFNTKSLKNFFGKATAVKPVSPSPKPTEQAISPLQDRQSTTPSPAKPTSRVWQPPPRPSASPAKAVASSNGDVSASSPQQVTAGIAKTPASPATDTKKRKASSSKAVSGKQMKLGSFFGSKSETPKPTPAPVSIGESSNDVTTAAIETNPKPNAAVDDEVDWDYLYSLPDPDAPAPASGKSNDNARQAASTTAAWSNLFTAPPAPLCTLHSEPCTSYRVNKRDSKNNYGRQFWLCSRQVGPNYEKGFGGWEGKGWGSSSSSAGMDVAVNRPPPPDADQGGGDPKQYRCGFFIWNSDWESEWRKKGATKGAARFGNTKK